MTSFDEFFTNDNSSPADNFITPTFTTFEQEKPYLLEITDANVSESKNGFYQIEMSVDAVGPSGAKQSMGRVWVSLPETIDGGEAEENLSKDPATEEHKKAAMLKSMFGRMTYQLLRAAAPERFAPYRFERSGKKTIAVDATGAALTSDQRKAADAELSAATVNFAKACVTGNACAALVGKRVWYKVVPRKNDPSRTNQVFLLESEIHD